MNENIENLVLEHLHHIRGKIDQIANDVSDLKIRMSRLESAMLSVKREIADGFEAEIRQQTAIDKLAERVDRIESRLDLL